MSGAVALKIGPIAIYWYGVILVSGALVGAFVASREARRRGDNPEHVWNGLILCLILGMIGARLYHVLSDLDFYLKNPLLIFATRRGGLGIYGAVAGGVLGVYIYTRLAGLSFTHWLDLGAIGLPLGQAIGRWANFVNQELYGYPTTVPWGIHIDAAHRLPQFADLSQYPLSTRFHPTFLYESIWNFLTFLALFYLARRYSDRLLDGDFILLYGILYPAGRFLVEFQRPDAWKILGVPTAQWVAVGSIILCGALLAYRHRQRSPRAPGS